MDKRDDLEHPRRGFLIQMLAAGLFAIGGGIQGRTTNAGIFGQVPRQMPPDRSIYDMRGEVRVNGDPAALDTLIRPNDLIETGRNAQLIFVVGQDAFIMREDSRLELSGSNILVDTLRLVSGKLLSVFGKTAHQFSTVTATIGIRGTGLYVEAEPDRSYVCTCYGITDIKATNDPASAETIESLHHDAPRYVLAQAVAGQHIQPAPFINHTDIELMLIEELVGRTPPFILPGGGYGAPRRGGMY